MTSFNDKFQKKWIEEGIDDDFIKYVEKFGLFLCDKDEASKNAPNPGKEAVTVTQIRNLFGEVKRIEQQMLTIERKPIDFTEKSVSEQQEILQKIEAKKNIWYPSFLMLKVKLAYNVGRVLDKGKTSNMKKFGEVFSEVFSYVKTPNHFDNFVKFFEAVIAFHKVYGGKDSDAKK